MQTVIWHGNLVLSMPAVVQAVACILALRGSPGLACFPEQVETISAGARLSCHSHQKYGIVMQEYWCCSV